MALRRLRIDSIEELRKQKSTAELQKENEQLKTEVATLSDQLTETQLGMCEVFEMVLGGA